MPVPVVVGAGISVAAREAAKRLTIWLLRLAGAATTAHEIVDLTRGALSGVEGFEMGIAEAKEYIRKQIEALKKEIDFNIDEKFEQAALYQLTAGDIKLQSPMTKRAEGRKGDNTPTIIAAIKQAIPFRQVIGKLCEAADNAPMIQLRRRSGIKPSDLLSKKKLVMEALLKLEDLTEVDVIDGLDDFITVRLKQLVLSFLIEFIDEMIDWRSPLKAEVCFGPRLAGFRDPPLEDGTKLKRVGTSLNPFYPMPIREQGALSADIVIPDYRKEPMKKENLFAIIEVKFPGDRIKNKQFRQYDELSRVAARMKTKITTLACTNGNLPVGKGCRVALFRYPEDMPKTKKPGSRSGNSHHR